MKPIRMTMVALLVVSLAAVLLSYGCRSKSTPTEVAPVVDTTAAVAPVADIANVSLPVAATPDTSGPGAGGGMMYAELANPQSDDQGCYCPVARDRHYSVVGYASGRRPVAQVMVNDVEADTFAANYQPYGSPSDFSPIGFRVPLTLSPDSIVTVSMIDADGYRETMIFYPERRRTYERVHQLWQGSQNDPYANVRMANTFAVMGDYHSAYERYHRCIGLDAGFVWGPFFMGVTLYDNNRYDDAMWQFRYASRIQPTFYLARYHVGQIYELQGNYGYAAIEYRAVIGTSPVFVAAQWSLGETYAQQGNWSGAALQYRQALQYNPRFALAHRGLGESLAHQGQWAGAAASLNLAASINPRDARTRADLSSTMMHQQRSPRQYRVAMAPLSAARGSVQGPARNTRHAQNGEAYQAVVGQQQTRPSGGHQIQSSGGQQAQPSGGHQIQSSGGQQAQPSGGHQAKPSGRNQSQPSGGHQAKPAARQQSRPAAKPTARPSGGRQAAPSGGHQAKPSGGQKGKPSGGQTDQKDKNKGH